MKTLVLPFIVVVGLYCAPCCAAAVEVKEDASGQVILSNEAISLAFNLTNGTYAITDKVERPRGDRPGRCFWGWLG